MKKLEYPANLWDVEETDLHLLIQTASDLIREAVFNLMMRERVKRMEEEREQEKEL